VNRIVVVGGGPVGLAFAICAAQSMSNTEVVVLERSPGRMALTDLADESVYDNRVYALSPQSIALLEGIDVWSRLPSGRITPIDEMRVASDADNVDADNIATAAAVVLPSIRFARGAALAHIVEHHQLVVALNRVLAENDVVIKYSTTLDSMTVNGSRRVLALTDGTSLEADLVVAADGRQSAVRKLAGIDAHVKDYASVGIVANFTCEIPHANIARQWFTPDGVLAYLPLPKQQVSIVWSVAQAHAATLPQRDSPDFADAAAKAGHHSLGRLTLSSLVEEIPLKRITAHHTVAPGLALIGDAAHAIHPLAGQGVNLGFADVQSLVDLLASRSEFSAVGDLTVLRRYARARSEAAVAMGEATDFLHALFSRNDNVSKWVRRAGFSWFDRSTWAKRVATEYAARS
jgi:ubiquinone biosynthesis UbiH/UbiF/VisC/COQ6 family hydroxylase